MKDSEAGSSSDLVIEHNDWRAAVCDRGAALRRVRRGDRELLDGFDIGAPRHGARGVILAPWTNRLRDGRYAFDGRSHRLAITDPATHTALHGLAAEERWKTLDHAPDAVQLGLRLAPSPGYPWELELSAEYRVDASGLTVTQRAENRSGTHAPFATGAHPYLLAAAGGVDDWTVRLDASRVLLVDERMLPERVVDAADVGLDLAHGRQIGATRLNHAFTGLRRDAVGRAAVTVGAPGVEDVTLWADGSCRWFQLYTGDFDEVEARRSLAVEPMSAPADAFNTGHDLVVLTPRGTPGSVHRLRWGIGGATDVS